ncbi:protein ANTI-SILENCING 1-like isoform X2 [Vigna radiata var. radiata]|uniref:Protein ANTI-SILENCING 1-like isoform X2 n=1 Tax=Vigna radiata var. radiata TaxID=3916 RepID=A0A1S3UCI9_VIGRR|nr:protein ANTI-SILENCING 1-like isoform X2 [Vigna radiata var. radiata]
MAAPIGEVDLNYEFAWGRKRGMGGKKKDVQFYESFTFDGVQYALNDTVYLQNESSDVPHIGKLIKVWENRDKSRKVKVQWFFRSREIQKFLEGIQTKENELFLACGDGKGFANVNPLEAIVGKCNVVCISKNIGNSQPKADFVFYRFFDVGQRKVVDQTDDKIAGTEVINISTK